MVSHPKFAKIRTGMQRGARVPDVVRDLVIKKWRSNIADKVIVEQLENVLSLRSVERIIAQEIREVKSGMKEGILPPHAEKREAKRVMRQLAARNAAQKTLLEFDDDGQVRPSARRGDDDEQSGLYWKKAKDGIRLFHAVLDLMPHYIQIYSRPPPVDPNDDTMFWQLAANRFNSPDYRPMPLAVFDMDPHLTGPGAKRQIMDPATPPRKPFPAEFLHNKFRDLQKVFRMAKLRWDRGGGLDVKDPYECCWEYKARGTVWPDVYYMLRLCVADGAQEVAGFTELFRVIEATAPSDARCEGFLERHDGAAAGGVAAGASDGAVPAVLVTSPGELRPPRPPKAARGEGFLSSGRPRGRADAAGTLGGFSQEIPLAAFS